MYFVYILFSSKGNKTYVETYVGITDDPTRRLNQHNAGYNFYTKRYTPWEIIHIENFSGRIEARRWEKYLKSAAGRR